MKCTSHQELKSEAEKRTIWALLQINPRSAYQRIRIEHLSAPASPLKTSLQGNDIYVDGMMSYGDRPVCKINEENKILHKVLKLKNTPTLITDRIVSMVAITVCFQHHFSDSSDPFLFSLRSAASTMLVLSLSLLPPH